MAESEEQKGGGEEQQMRPPGAQEGKRFEQQEDNGIPEGLPERFLKDGKPDYANLTKSYVELDRSFKKKTEDLTEQLRTEMFKDRPETPDKYEIPKIEGVELPDDSPLIGWWREQAHQAGMGQDGFESGIKAYIERSAQLFDPAAEKAKLGQNADARLEAVGKWAESQFKDAEYTAIAQIASTAAGVTALEKLMNSGRTLEDDGEDQDDKDEMTVDKLREMQKDPRYYDQARRDPAFVKEVDAGYAKLFGAK